MKRTGASTNEAVYTSFEELERKLFPLSTARRNKKPSQDTGFAAEFLRKLRAELHLNQREASKTKR